MLERGDILDLLFADDECLALTHDRCLRLTAVPTEVLAYLTVPRTVAEVSEHLEGIFGPAPEGIFEALINDLTQDRLVSRTDVTPAVGP
ncbi:hypothetical protein [Candidatus Neomicrothrix sp.]|uniref:hypothetical protein n=1 Tax=Candidatus Neomicrothrix sp. TaxID=2719034 RepID=UPI00259A8AD8|nr:hypothetical protein [Candidatus Microthrix sp.]HMS46778.1 hypothetical protein [Candidatus Microthrix sp.]